MVKKAGLGCLGLIVVIIAIGAIASGTGGQSTSRTGNQANSSIVSTPVPVTPTNTSSVIPTVVSVPQAEISASPTNVSSVVPTIVSAPQAVVAETPTNTPNVVPTVASVPQAPINDGIVFGKPLVQSIGENAIVEVLATNTTDRTKSFTAKATIKSGDNIAATAVGAVNDMLPGQKRAITMISTDPLPNKYDTIRIDVDTLVSDAPATAGGNVAGKIKFGPPAVKSIGQIGSVDVEVTNGDSASHSFTVQAAFVKSGQLVGVEAGAVNDLSAGQTKTATLLGTSAIPAYDQVLIEVDSMVK